MQPTQSREIIPRPARIIGSVFGGAFALIGLIVLGFLWSTPHDQFGAPPLVFRLFGSVIAIVFVVFGGMMCFASLTGKLSPRMPTLPDSPAGTPVRNSTQTSYVCPHCAAPLGRDANVSPSGDVLCPFCHRWFNTHQQDRG